MLLSKISIGYLAAIISAYLLGSIPVGLFVVQLLTKKDIRTIGSGRTGGTNAFRAGGIWAGVLTALGDLLKGFGAVYLARLILSSDHLILEAICAVAVVIGHNWSAFIGFKGGAGTTPTVGAAIALWPTSAMFLIPLIPALLVLTGYASVTSTALVVAIIITFVLRWWLADQPVAYIGFAIGAALMVGLSLIPNYRRLIAGTERLVGPRAKAQARRSENSA